MDDKDETAAAPPEKVPDPEWLEAEAEGDNGAGHEGPLTVADFHHVAQKQILNAVFATLADTKMDWALIAPFFESAREVCIGDIEENAQIRLHTLQQEGETWIEADEAFLGISVSDREDGSEWLSDTYWLSDIAIAEGDPAQVRAIVRALEKSVAKINAWLADKP
jgi:hypothetical protein